MTIWFTINYVPMAHMGWGGGWVFALGAQDFAGGNVVHVNVGITALVGAWLVGARKGVGTSAMSPHNMTMTMTGGSMLWVGWLAFCGGCALARPTALRCWWSSTPCWLLRPARCPGC